jgi:hypothetical protein
MQITSSWFAVGLEGPDFVRANFFRSKGSARVQCYDKLGNRDLIHDSVSIQNIETGFVSSTGMLTRRKMFDWERVDLFFSPIRSRLQSRSEASGWFNVQ